MPVLTVPVTTGPRRLDALAAPAGEDAVAAVREAAAPLRRLRVVHLVTPPFAPRALDLLRSTVPLLRDAGLDVRWLAVAGDERADAAARAAGDGLRGGEPGSAEDVADWRARGAAAAADVPAGTDVVVVHGAESLALLGAARDQRGAAARWVWWIETDLHAPDPELWRAAADLVDAASTVVAEREGWAPPGVSAETIAPAIDPLAPRNLDLVPRVAGGLARAAGVSLDRPFAVLTADTDGWSLPEDALRTLRVARDAGAGELRLVVAAQLPAGDARAWRTLGELGDHLGGEDDVLVVPNVGGVGDAEVNALQRLARAALAEREDDVGALEAAWKGTPVVTAGDGARLAELVADPGLAVEEGRAARERVRASGLVTRLLADQLALYARITSAA